MSAVIPVRNLLAYGRVHSMVTFKLDSTCVICVWWRGRTQNTAKSEKEKKVKSTKDGTCLVWFTHVARFVRTSLQLRTSMGTTSKLQPHPMLALLTLAVDGSKQTKKHKSTSMQIRRRLESAAKSLQVTHVKGIDYIGQLTRSISRLTLWEQIKLFTIIKTIS